MISNQALNTVPIKHFRGKWYRSLHFGDGRHSVAILDTHSLQLKCKSYI